MTHCNKPPPASRYLNEDLNPGLWGPVQLGEPGGSLSAGVEAAAPGGACSGARLRRRGVGDGLQPALATTPPGTGCRPPKSEWVRQVSGSDLSPSLPLLISWGLLILSAAPDSRWGAHVPPEAPHPPPSAPAFSLHAPEGGTRRSLIKHLLCAPGGVKHFTFIISLNHLLGL